MTKTPAQPVAVPANVWIKFIAVMAAVVTGPMLGATVFALTLRADVNANSLSNERQDAIIQATNDSLEQTAMTLERIQGALDVLHP